MDKPCTKCGGYVPIVKGMFICQPCNNIRVRLWSRANRDRVRQYKKDYRKKNLQKSREWDKNKRIKHAVKISARGKIYSKLICEKRRARGLWQNYGMTIAEFEDKLRQQGGKCGLCRTDKPFVKPNSRSRHWHVDHDHSCCPKARSCGKCVRALLCSNCNLMLGNAKDDISILQMGILYLVRYSRQVPLSHPESRIEESLKIPEDSLVLSVEN